jgi:hypothetical protein
MLATIAASPLTVQILALVAAVLFLVAAVIALMKPTEPGDYTVQATNDEAEFSNVLTFSVTATE